jgi:hypothetical protein
MGYDTRDLQAIAQGDQEGAVEAALSELQRADDASQALADGLRRELTAPGEARRCSWKIAGCLRVRCACRERKTCVKESHPAVRRVFEEIVVGPGIRPDEQGVTWRRNLPYRDGDEAREGRE